MADTTSSRPRISANEALATDPPILNRLTAFIQSSRVTTLLRLPTHAHAPHGPVKGTKQRGIATGLPRRARDASSTAAPSFDMTTDFGVEDSLPSHVVRSITPTGCLYLLAVVDVSLGSHPICPARARWQSERRRSGPGRGCGVAAFWRFTAMSDVSHILSAIEQGDPRAAERLLPLV